MNLRHGVELARQCRPLETVDRHAMRQVAASSAPRRQQVSTTAARPSPGRTTIGKGNYHADDRQPNDDLLGPRHLALEVVFVQAKRGVDVQQQRSVRCVHRVERLVRRGRATRRGHCRIDLLAED
jgi:hypothetical protein